jgi:hypothetical protein
MKRLLEFKDGAPQRVVEFAGDSQLSALRIQDALLTTLVQGYKNEQMVASTLFPEVPVKKEVTRFPAFGQEAFKIYDTSRALRGPVKKMEVTTNNMVLELDEHSMGFMLDDRELEEFAGTKDALMTIRLKMVSDALDLEREHAAAVLATSNGSYGTNNKISAPSSWSTSGNPIEDILLGREAIRSAIGQYPNVCIFDPKAWRLFITNSIVRDYIKYTQTAVVTEDIAATLLEIPTVKVGRAVYGIGSGGGAGETALTTYDAWSPAETQAGNVVLAWVGTGYGVPSFGYNAIKEGYPRATTYRWEPQFSDVCDEHRIYADVITMANAGFLLYNLG